MKKLLAAFGLISLIGAGCAAAPQATPGGHNVPSTYQNNVNAAGSNDIDAADEAAMYNNINAADNQAQLDAAKLESQVNAEIKEDESNN